MRTKTSKPIIVIIAIVMLMLLFFSIKIPTFSVNTPFSKMENDASHSKPLKEDTLKSIDLGKNATLNLVTDSGGNIYTYLIYDEEIVASEEFVNLNNLDEEIYQMNMRRETSKYDIKLFLGMIANKEIDRVTVNGTEDIHYFDYQDQKFFYNTKFYNGPVSIEEL
ncbi:hypothetical protein [Bacillus solimangrovi]|uniref:Uncharacterized protein n=1 Tax=Bacillus solimangrovi TaxID=1305675 RepID=A0A1E5LJI8_9BACI|nr:hypothetical protein [Bacillus solimangrovi]OEH94262.1 hypothetical protein BFG57_08365 [Bacillus solimangrovi]